MQLYIYIRKYLVFSLPVRYFVFVLCIFYSQFFIFMYFQYEIL